jgi:hypothetical protein
LDDGSDSEELFKKRIKTEEEKVNSQIKLILIWFLAERGRRRLLQLAKRAILYGYPWQKFGIGQNHLIPFVILFLAKIEGTMV